jgi:hypothetical protein
MEQRHGHWQVKLKKSFVTLERRILRKMCGPTKENGQWRIKTNEERRMKYEMIYQLDAIEYLFVFFQLDMFRAYTPTSGAMDITISLHMQHMVSLV